MGLDNIQLSPSLLLQLYNKTLVDLTGLQQKSPVTQQYNISFLGKNEKKILVLVNETDTTFLPVTDLNLLINILSACKITMADIALINFDKNREINYDILMNYFEPASVLLFGINPADLQFPMHFPHYQLQHYNNQTYICAPALPILATDKEKKKQLWNSLQKHFF